MQNSYVIWNFCSSIFEHLLCYGKKAPEHVLLNALCSEKQSSILSALVDVS